MPHKCSTFWGLVADELSFVIWEQSVAAGYVSGWGAHYEDDTAYSACINLYDQLNAALGTDPEGPLSVLGYQPGQFPAGNIASLAMSMGEGLHFDKHDTTPGQMDRHNLMGFPWLETNAGNVPNRFKPDLDDLRRRIRDVLEAGRETQPMPEMPVSMVQQVPMGMPHNPADPDAEPSKDRRARRAKHPLVLPWRRGGGGGGGGG